MKTKIELLKEYIQLQAEDHGLWFIPSHITEDYLQKELRKVAWMIEEASIEEIQSKINELEIDIQDTQ